MATYAKRSRLGVPADAAFAWHTRPGALERLLPPWSGAAVLRRSGTIESGGRTTLRMPVGPIGLRWVAEHRDFQAGRSFRDVQIDGPFRLWEHVHAVEPVAARECDLEDSITYEMPFGRIGAAVAEPAIRRELERTFAFRHRTTTDDLHVHALRFRRPLRIAVTGPDELVGRALWAFLSTGGHQVSYLGDGPLDDAALDRLGDLEPVDAVVCLRPREILARRWPASRKLRVLREHVADLRAIADRAIGWPRRPSLVCLSSVGLYGARGYERLDDDASLGSGLWSELAREGEQATDVARAAGVRVVHLRTGLVLTSAGGVLRRMLPAFRLGLGPVLGGGRNYVPWASLDDVLGVVLWALTGDELHGAVNLVAPEPVTQRELAATLAHMLERPTGPDVPSGIARAALGEIGRHVLMASIRAVPAKLLRIGYPFRHPTLASALRHTLGAADR